MYGNCQSTALAELLGEDGALGQTHDVILLPRAHEATAQDVPRMLGAVEQADIVVTQRVRDHYRGLEIGSGQLLAHSSPSAKTILYPALYYDAFFPFQVMLRSADGRPSPAPLTTYHDLRHVAAAINGLSVEDLGHWLTALTLDPAVCQAFADAADQRYGEYEAGLDVRLTDDRPGRRFGPQDFHTVDHPTLATLIRVRDAVLSALDVSPGPVAVTKELLGEIRTPVPREVLSALNCTPQAGLQNWLIGNESHTAAAVAQVHLKHYRKTPELLRDALGSHQQRLDALGLLG